MKWSFVVRQKLKIATLLSIVMLSIIVFNLLSSGNMKGMGRSFDSIYQDRLIPAIDLVYLVESMYNKRLLVERHLLKGDSTQVNPVKSAIGFHNNRIDSLLVAYNRTEQTRAEKQSFSELSDLLGQYKQLESQVLLLWLQGDHAAGWQLFDIRGEHLFGETIATLNRLTDIQSQVAEELINESKTDVSVFNLYSMLQIVLAIIIGIIIMILITTSKTLPSKTTEKYPFHMN